MSLRRNLNDINMSRMTTIKTEEELKMQVYFALAGVAVVLGAMFFQALDVYHLGSSLVHYVFYLLLLRASRVACDVTVKAMKGKPVKPAKVLHDHRKSLIVFGLDVFILQYLGELLIKEEFGILFIADLICQYLELEEKRPIINYGVGMACSYFEGYLMNIIPDDGVTNGGLIKNINIFENQNKVVVPVKKLLVVVTQSLFCPPNLDHFNNRNRPDLAYLEACRSLEDVTKDVAGVKGRSYRNSTYRIVRPDRPKDEGVFVVAEFASPLNTFHKVLQNRDLYQRLCGVDQEEIKHDFCEQLEYTVANSPATKGALHLVRFDDTNPDLNLADVLLKEIGKLEPNYDQLVRNNAQERRNAEFR